MFGVNVARMCPVIETNSNYCQQILLAVAILDPSYLFVFFFIVYNWIFHRPFELFPSMHLGTKFPLTSRDCKQYNNGRSYYRLVQWEFRENFPDLPFHSILISNANETSRNNERRSSIELSAVACINVCQRCRCCSDFAELSASDEGIVLVFALLKLTRNQRNSARPRARARPSETYYCEKTHTREWRSSL